jgi:hypothetical protein
VDHNQVLHTPSAQSANCQRSSFIYGGWDGHPGERALQFDEIFALSLPAFRWFRVYSQAAASRVGHTCHIIGQRQLLSIGGADMTRYRPVNGSDDLRRPMFASRDHHAQGLAVYDVTSLKWTNFYDADAAPYEQSAPVADFYQQQ